MGRQENAIEKAIWLFVAAVGVIMFFTGVIRIHSMGSQVVRFFGGHDSLSDFLLIVGPMTALAGSVAYILCISNKRSIDI